MANEVTDAISQWLINDPGRYDDAQAKAREGLDYLEAYVLEEIRDADTGNREDGTHRPHDGGPERIRRTYSDADLESVDWEEVRDDLVPLPRRTTLEPATVLANAVGDTPWATRPTGPPATGGLGLEWVLGLIRTYLDGREEAIWSEYPEDFFTENPPNLPGTQECWGIFYDLGLYAWEPEIVFEGWPFKREDYEHGTVSVFKLKPEVITKRTKERIGTLAELYLEEVQRTILSQLLDEDRREMGF